MPVKTGLDVLVEENFSSLKNKRVALLGHPASVDKNLNHLLDLCLANGVQVTKLFGAEHGFLGNAQYMEAVDHARDPRTKIPTISLYGASRESLLLQKSELADIDVLVCDLQDVGSRYYTFAYTIAFALRACAQTKTRCIVLDRPNPINGIDVEGNLVQDSFRSFVGEYPLPNRHGLTIGELALFFKQHDKLSVDLEVIWMKGWNRNMYFEATGLPWVLPSPNMPTIDTAVVYPGGCLLEGTNLSEGRGTTKPFELIGAPYITDPYYFAELISKNNLTGVTLRPCWFTPQFDKHAHKLCAGIQLHVTNRSEFKPLRCVTSIIWAARQFEGFDWRREPYEFVGDRLAIDLLYGIDAVRRSLERGALVDDLGIGLSSKNPPKYPIDPFIITRQ